MRWFRAALALTLCVAVGCGDGKSAVTGQVEMDGQPISGATVTFLPVAGTPGPGGVGGTDATGKYTLSNFQGKPGVVAGEYKVTVTKQTLKNPPKGDKVAVIDTDFVHLLPAIYAKAETTPLTAKVERTGGKFDFKLVSKK